MRYFLCSLLCILNLFSTEEEQPVSLIDYSKSPVTRVAGSVNIISGDWIDQETHNKVSGPDPYVVAHSYNSSSLDEGTLADGWDLFHPSELEIYQPKGIYYNRKGCGGGINAPEGIEKGSHHKKHHDLGDRSKPNTEVSQIDNKATLFYREAGGATIVFKGSAKCEHFEPKLHDTGYTVVGSIEQPILRDIHRARIHWIASADQWVVKLGDGTRRVYSRVDKNRMRPTEFRESYFKRTYHIHEERLPSGNVREFHYDDDKELQRVDTYSSDHAYLLHSVSFRRKKEFVYVETSDKQTTRFSLKKLHDRENATTVTAIRRPGMADCKYEYSDKSPNHVRRVCERHVGSRPDVVKYYHEGTNIVHGKKISLKGKKKTEFLRDRVREIQTRDFAGNPVIPAYSFFYEERDEGHLATVRESDGSSTTYRWDKKHRPIRVRSNDPSGMMLHKEHFTWSPEGRLLKRTLLDEAKNPILDRECVYDDRGNAIEEIVRGSVQKFAKQTTLRWKATYSDDSRSLKTSETDPLGNKTYFEYDPSRNLMTARFTCDGKRIIQREFFAYDSAAVCVKSTIDDGSSRHRKNLTDVTKRTIHRITPRRTPPISVPLMRSKRLFGLQKEEKRSSQPTVMHEITTDELLPKNRSTHRATFKNGGPTTTTTRIES